MPLQWLDLLFGESLLESDGDWVSPSWLARCYKIPQDWKSRNSVCVPLLIARRWISSFLSACKGRRDRVITEKHVVSSKSHNGIYSILDGPTSEQK